MVKTPNYDLDIDSTLGGSNASDYIIPSQKAVKDYVDNHSSSVSADGITINTNSSDELQAIGLINKNTANGATNPKYDWVGTLQEYEDQNVATAHPEWICYITDDVSGGTSVYTKSEVDNLISATLSAVYPVGSIYIGTTSTCPIASLISGSTWTIVSSGRVLQGADSGHSAGSTIEAGLPNITGSYYADRLTNSDSTQVYSGALYIGTSTKTGSTPAWQGETGFNTISFDASLSNPIYGNSTTVQPPAYVVNIWQRTA
jgi:hypothetical protein